MMFGQMQIFSGVDEFICLINLSTLVFKVSFPCSMVDILIVKNQMSVLPVVNLELMFLVVVQCADSHVNAVFSMLLFPLFYGFPYLLFLIYIW